jgi:hypothetical protein
VLLSLYLCASAGTPPLYVVMLPDQAACRHLLARLQADQRDAAFPDSVPGRLECRPVEEGPAAQECQGGGP